MKIEISLADNGKPLASSYSKFYTSQSDPIVDVIVREAIQNSLDAGLNTDPQAESKEHVVVDFSIGKFPSKALASQLEGITDQINRLYPQEFSSYLSIRDIYTSGLTGALSFRDCEDPENPGNLIKLVFNIAQPNKDEGAGGSCGIGKTVFYTLGAGIVVYYSRVFDRNVHAFQSRLVACMIETNHTGIIPDLNGEKSIGIAWWGDACRGKKNKILPITDESRIKEVLSIFGAPEYVNTETGTTLIIPYIDADELASRNANNRNTLQKCIRDAVQRWYFPRLLNHTYTDFFSSNKVSSGSRKYLRVMVDGKPLTRSMFYPLVNIYQALYNRALTGENTEDEYDYLKEQEVNLEQRIDIRVNNKMENPIAGYLSYCYVTPKTLRMTVPDNNPSPEEFLYLINQDSETDTSLISEPILGFCRRAGMIGSFNSEGWLSRVPDLPDNIGGKYMLCMFVLNSSNVVNFQTCNKKPGETLDAYVRKSELNDHKDWKNDPYGIIDKIKKNTASKLSAAIKEQTKTEEPSSNRDGRIAQALTEALLPPIGFGRKANITPSGGGRSRTLGNSSGSLRLVDVRYNDDSMIVEYEFSSSLKQPKISFDLQVKSEGGKMSVREWTDMGLPIPFEISKIELNIHPRFLANKYFSLNADKRLVEGIGYNYTSLLINQRAVVHGVEMDFCGYIQKTKGRLRLTIKILDHKVKTILIREFS